MKRCITFVALILTPGSVLAQDAWSDLRSEGLSTVYVLDDTGQETTGELLQLDADALVLLVEGTERRFEAEQIIRLDKRGDSVRNGLLIGVAIGAVLGLMSDAGPLVGALGFGGIGLGIDALRRGRTTLYEASGSVAILHSPPTDQQLPAAHSVEISLSW